ncbi:MAG TPA: hypothetical protein VIK72_07270 [Clostridiaceae bacterium]
MAISIGDQYASKYYKTSTNKEEVSSCFNEYKSHNCNVEIAEYDDCNFIRITRNGLLSIFGSIDATISKGKKNSLISVAFYEQGFMHYLYPGLLLLLVTLDFFLHTNLVNRFYIAITLFFLCIFILEYLEKYFFIRYLKTNLTSFKKIGAGEYYTSLNG